MNVGNVPFFRSGEFTAAIVLARCKQTPSGSYRWTIRLEHGLNPDVFIAVRMDTENQAPLDYYVLPRLDMTFEKMLLAEENGVYLDVYRFDDLDVFAELAARVDLDDVA